MKNKTKPSVLFYDCETTPLLAYIWRLGDQFIGHHQLAKWGYRYNLICVSYAFNDGKPAKTFDWGYDAQDSGRVIREFDKIIKQADITIGKNSDQFDVRHINAQRLLHKLPPLPDWMNYTDDLEKQIRRHFIFPSFSLDYISKELGLGGKVKMDFTDWIDIAERKNRASFDKMIRYNKKDVLDTRALWNKMQPYITPKFNMATYCQDFCCTKCGSKNLKKDGLRYRGMSRYQQFWCRDCKSYAGRATIGKSGSLGKMQS
jgi:hypothetical protein